MPLCVLSCFQAPSPQEVRTVHTKQGLPSLYPAWLPMPHKEKEAFLSLSRSCKGNGAIVSQNSHHIAIQETPYFTAVSSPSSRYSGEEMPRKPIFSLSQIQAFSCGQSLSAPAFPSEAGGARFSAPAPCTSGNRPYSLPGSAWSAGLPGPA